MPVLLLLRHAKSSWDDPGLGDFERPLAPRGLRAAPAMGAEIEARDWVPDLAIVSAAVRARQTLDLAAAEWRTSPAVRFEQKLYMASTPSILALANAIDTQIQTAMLVGHNPGMENFARFLAGPSSKRPALDTMVEKFPTTALARFTFEGEWRSLTGGGAALTHFLRPRDLALG